MIYPVFVSGCKDNNLFYFTKSFFKNLFYPIIVKRLIINELGPIPFGLQR